MVKKKPSYNNYNGFLIPQGFPIEGFQSGLAYVAQPDDIFIATYPKCGTTWTMYIVWLILHNGEPLEPTKRLEQFYPHLEEVGKETINALPSPHVIKTHLPYGMTPYHPQSKYIYIARNPFDCLVSFYHHTRRFIKHYDFAEGQFDVFFECFIQGEVDFGDYFDNLTSWYEKENEHFVLFLTYEQMKQDIEASIKKIACFIGCKQVIEDKFVMKKIISHSSFSSMSRDQQRWSSKRPDHMPAFIRKGKVGDWRSYFSDEQKARLMNKLLSKGDVKSLWDQAILS